MKKTYIAPQTETMSLMIESSLLSASNGITVDKNSSITTEEGFLSNDKDEWCSDSWTTED